MLTALSMLVALAMDWLIGWPDTIYRRIGHPVTWLGHLIAMLDRRLNQQTLPRRSGGIVTALLVTGSAVGAAIVIARLLPEGILGAIIAGVIAWPLVAARSMSDHVEAVLHPMADGSLEDARREVSKIVGRDPEMLDTPGVSRAAIESLAENTSDGVIAPLFWGVVFGLPGIAGYKAINTLDSMIGHRSERYLAFGWASARLDDVANLAPARLTGVFFALAAQSAAALRVMVRDASLHRSPNAGWPEAAMAGALDVRLSGPRGYGGIWNDEPWINAGAKDPTAEDLSKALRVYRRILLGSALVLAGLALL